jgi:endoglucanase
MIADLGLNMVCLPLDYRCWINDDNPYVFDEEALRQINQAIEWIRQYKLNVSLKMYHPPGYRLGFEYNPRYGVMKGCLIYLNFTGNFLPGDIKSLTQTVKFSFNQ